MPIIDKAIRLLLDHSDTIGRMMHDNFRGSALAHVSDRQLMVSQETMRMEIEKIEEAKPWLKSLKCGPDGIMVQIEGKRFGAAMGALLLLRIEKIIMTDEEQSIVLHVVEETTVGRDLWGKILCGVGSVFLGSFMRQALEFCNLKRYADFNEKNRLMTIRIGELDTVQRMLEPKIPGWPDSAPLRLLGVNGAEHVEGGIIMKLVPSPRFEQWREKLRTASQRRTNASSDKKTKTSIYERTWAMAARVSERGSNPREKVETCRGVYRLGKRFLEALRNSETGEAQKSPNVNSVLNEAAQQNYANAGCNASCFVASGMSEGARFLVNMLGEPTDDMDFSNNLFLRKMLERAGYDYDAIVDELEIGRLRMPSRSCATCENPTLYMTSCCHRPICNACFRKHRFSLDGSVYKPLGYTGHRKMGGNYDWRCSHCGHTENVLDYDPDSDALTYARMSGYEPPVIAVRIDTPDKKAGWI